MAGKPLFTGKFYFGRETICALTNGTYGVYSRNEFCGIPVLYTLNFQAALSKLEGEQAALFKQEQSHNADVSIAGKPTEIQLTLEQCYEYLSLRDEAVKSARNS